MKYILGILLLLLFVASATAVPAPMTHNGKQYYKVDANIADEDTGNEVCGKVGLSCVGYTDMTTAVCKLYNPSAATTSSSSGDASGIYCNGAPQTGVCATASNTCHACPACTNGVDCGTPIGNLYREMYVECVSPSTSGCPVVMYARNTPQLLNEIAALNTRIQACPSDLPKGTGWIISNGNVVLDINMNSGTTQSITVAVANKKIVGVTRGVQNCKQRLSVSETNLDAMLNSKDRVNAFLNGYANKQISVKGCTVLRKISTFFVAPISRIILKRSVPPPPPPPSNCAALGAPCNNNGCLSGICGSPKENFNGQWRFANYRCLDQRGYDSYCRGHGNTPPAWDCMIHPCS